MSLDWITFDDEEAKDEPKSKPKTQSVTVNQREDISHISTPSVLVDAATIDSLPDYELTTELPGHQNASTQGVSSGTFIQFEGEKKAHQLGNSTGTAINILFSRVLSECTCWSVRPLVRPPVGPSVHRFVGKFVTF